MALQVVAGWVLELGSCPPMDYIADDTFQRDLPRTPKNSPGSPVVKTSSSNSGGSCLIPGQGAHMPHSQKTKTENRNSIVKNSIKNFKNGPHQ